MVQRSWIEEEGLSVVDFETRSVLRANLVPRAFLRRGEGGREFFSLSRLFRGLLT